LIKSESKGIHNVKKNISISDKCCSFELHIQNRTFKYSELQNTNLKNVYWIIRMMSEG